jgi:hypothetical protein
LDEINIRIRKAISGQDKTKEPPSTPASGGQYGARAFSCYNKIVVNRKPFITRMLKAPSIPRLAGELKGVANAGFIPPRTITLLCFVTTRTGAVVYKSRHPPLLKPAQPPEIATFIPLERSYSMIYLLFCASTARLRDGEFWISKSVTLEKR